jgi:hypothetical protein
MNAATYTRSCLRKRNVNKSDCHSWFGSARSKRAGEAFAPGLRRVATALGSIPSLLRMRRTVVSEVPRPRKRLTTSRMRRLPACGCAALTDITASRLGSGLAAWIAAFMAGLRGSNACSPPIRYFRPHSPTVVYGTFNRRDTSLALIPWSTIIEAAVLITSGGQTVRPRCVPLFAALRAPASRFASTSFAPFGHRVQPGGRRSARYLCGERCAHQVVRSAQQRLVQVSLRQEGGAEVLDSTI